jgi:hypothetical protein
MTYPVRRDFHVILAIASQFTQTCHPDRSNPTLFLHVRLRTCRIAQWRDLSSISRASPICFVELHYGINCPLNYRAIKFGCKIKYNTWLGNNPKYTVPIAVTASTTFTATGKRTTGAAIASALPSFMYITTITRK